MATLLYTPSLHYDPQRHSSLLHLDCSTDLRAYSRSLGPNVPAQSMPIPTINDDDLRRHSRTRRHESYAVIPSTRPTDQAPSLARPEPYSDTPEPPQPRQEWHAIAGDINTYPPTLREALNSSSHFPEDHSEGTSYTVLDQLHAIYRDNWTNIIGSTENLHDANLKAADYFIKTYGPKPDDDKLEMDLRDDGSLHMQLEHGDGLQSVSVERTRLGA